VASFQKPSLSLSSTKNIENFILFFRQFGASISATKNDLKSFSEEFLLVRNIGSDSLDLIGQAFRDFAPNVKAAVQIVVVEVAAMVDRVAAKIAQLNGVVKNVFSSDPDIKTLEIYESKINAITAARKSSIEQIILERDESIKTARESLKTSEKSTTTNSNFGNPTTTGTAGDQYKAAEEAARQHKKNLADIEKEFWDSVDAEGAMWDQVQEAKDVSKSMELELASRQQVAQFYRDAEAAGIEGSYAREAALLSAQAEERRAVADQRFAEDTQKRIDQEAQALEAVGANAQARAMIIAEYNNQERLAAEIHAADMLAIDQALAEKRKRLDEQEAARKIKLGFDIGQSGIALLQAFGSKSEKTQKRLAKISIAADTAQGVAAGVKLGWPAGVPAVAWAIANGKKAMDALNSSGSVSASSATAAQPMPTTATSNEPAFEQKKVIELRGITPETLLSGQQFIDALTSTGAVVAMNNAQAQAQRIGVI